MRDWQDQYYAIDLLERDYAGTMLERELTGEALRIKLGDGGSEGLPLLVGSMAEWSFYAEASDDLSFLYTSDLRKYKVEIRKDDPVTGAMVWTGWLMVQELQQPMRWEPEVTLSARCGLGELKETAFAQPDGSAYTGRKSWLELLTIILGKLDLGLNIHTAVNFRALEMGAGNPLAQAWDDCAIYDGMNCREVLEQLLTNCRIMQRDGAWYAEAYTALKLTSYTQYNYDYTGTALTPATTVVTPRKAIDQAATWNEGTPTLEYLPAWEKLETEQEYGLQESFFKNHKLATGDGWTVDSGLTVRHVDLEDEQYCIIEGIGASGTALGVRQSVEVKAFAGTFQFALKLSPLGWYSPSSDAVKSVRKPLSVLIKYELRLQTDTATYYLHGDEGWKEGQYWMEKTAESSIPGELKWTEVSVDTDSLPGDGTLTVTLRQTPNFILGPTQYYDGVAYTEVVAFEKNELEEKLKLTARNNGSYLEKGELIAMKHGTLVPNNNAPLLWIGGTGYDSDPRHQSTGWYVDNTVQTYGYSVLMARMAMSLRRKHLAMMAGTVVGGYGPGVVYNELNQPGIDYVLLSGDWNVKPDSFEGQWAELTAYDPEACTVTTDAAKRSSAGRRWGSRGGVTTVTNNYNLGNSFDQIGGNPADNNALKEYLDKITDSVIPDTRSVILSGAVVWVTGMKFESTMITYLLSGQRNELSPQPKTLDAADPLLPRIDVFFVDGSSELGVLKGTQAENPVKPTVSAGQLEVTQVYVPAGATTPEVDVETIYDENAEWTTAQTADTDISVDFNAANDPTSGLKNIDIALAIPDTTPATPTHSMGELYQGGRIFYLPRGGAWGLIAAEDYAGEEVYERLSSDWDPYTTGANGTIIGTGDDNTALLMAHDNAKNFAAALAANYRGGGYDDWFMGSLDEMKELVFRRGYFPRLMGAAWTSSEVTGRYNWKRAYCVDLSTQGSYIRDKNNRMKVVPIRKFDDSTIPTGVPVEVYTPTATTLTFTAPAPVATGGGILSFDLRTSGAWLQNTALRIELYNGATLAGSLQLSKQVSLWGWNDQDELWQKVAIRLSSFGVTAAQIDKVKLTLLGSWPNGVTLSLDRIRLQHDSGQALEAITQGTYGSATKSLVLTTNSQGKVVEVQEIDNGLGDIAAALDIINGE